MKNKNLPLVSIITPAYNRALFLDETISSVLGQDYPHIEYIVLDDGSTDGTAELLKSYPGRITWISHQNMGETRTVNKGFSMANGEIIGVVNSDDPLLPGAVSRIVQCFIADKDLLVAYPDWNMIDEQGNIIQSITTYEYSFVDMIRWHHCVPGPGTFFRREVVEKTGGRDSLLRYVADFDFWIRAGLLGKFARVPERLATFRLHQDSASVSHQGKTMAKEHIRLVEKFYSLPGLPEALRSVRREAYSSAFYVAGCVCGRGAPFARKMYFFAAVLLTPFKYLGEYRDRTFFMFPLVMKVLYFLFGWFLRCYSKINDSKKDAGFKCLP